ncbi:MAG: twin-arginine translocation signal domain-containing protein, partial [Actinomycetota bacterium]
MPLSRRAFLKYAAAGAGAAALPSILPTRAFAVTGNAACLWGAFPDPGANASTAQVEN